jgi:hypothetical protein
MTPKKLLYYGLMPFWLPMYGVLYVIGLGVGKLKESGWLDEHRGTEDKTRRDG